MVEKENGVKSGIVDNTHMPTVTNQTMDLVVNRLNTVIATTTGSCNPSFVAEIGVVGVRSEKVVQAVAKG